MKTTLSTTKHEIHTLAAVLLAIAMALPACLPLLTRHEVSGGDVGLYIPRLVEFHENLKDGIWLPRWAPDLSHGHGQPLFVFVPPLVQYLGEFWILLGLDAPVALRYVAVAAVVTASISMFLLGRLLFGNIGGLLASVAFVYAPYFAVDLFVRRALAEFVALAFFPAGLYGLVQYYRTRDRRKLLTTVVAYSAIVLTHNGAALLFTGTSLAFVVYLAWRSRSWRVLAEQTLALGLALMLTAFFWLPSLTEMSAVHIERTINGYFDYRHHFVYPWQLLATTWGFGGSVIGDADNMSFSLGWSHVLCAIVAILLHRRVSAEHRSAIFFFAMLTLTASYMTIQKSSSVFWSRIPLLPFLQFPWRFLCVAILGTALLAGALGAILETFARARAPLVLCALLLLTLPNLSHLKPQAFFDWEAHQWTPDAIARRGVETTALGEYEPRWVEYSPAYEGEKINLREGAGTVTMSARTPQKWTLAADLESGGVAEIPQFYFPGWTATVDGSEVPIEAAAGAGLMQVLLSKGRHTVTLTFQNTRIRQLAIAMSAAGLAFVVLFAARRRAATAQFANSCMSP